MNKTNATVGQLGPNPHPGPKHITDNLNAQLGVIMVQMGRIMKAPVGDQDRAVEHANKRMIEATNSFHSTLDDMEIEIMSAKAVFLRDLEILRGRQQPSQAAATTAHVAPPAPMVINLDGLRPKGPAVPVAPMMGTGGSPFVAAHGIPKTEGKPVAPFPDMGAPAIPAPKPVAAMAFSKVKPPPVDQKRPSPKQTKQPTPKQAHKPAPKSNPASARMANKPNPMANAQKQAPKLPATAPPAAPAVAPAPMAVAPAAPMAPVAAAQPPPPQPPPQQPTASVPHFTNATFTLGPTNNEPMMQSGGGDSSLDMPMMDMDFGTGAQGDSANNDSTMDDLDHFFDMDTGNSNANAETSDFNNVDEYRDFNFDIYE